MPYTVHTTEYKTAHPLLRQKIREKPAQLQRKQSRERDILHDQTVAALTVCRPLTAELDLTNGI
jgi:hypothetical protein